MPNIKGRMNEFFQRQLTFVSPPQSISESNSTRSNPKRSTSFKENYASKNNDDITNDNASEGCFIRRYLNGQIRKNQPDVIFGKTCYDLPVKAIAPLSSHVVSAYTGPSNGLTGVNSSKKSKAFELPADAEVDFIDEDLDNENQSLDSSKQLESDKDQAKECSEQLSSASSCTSEKSLESTSLESHGRSTSIEEIAGIKDWSQSTDDAFGISTTLYESHPTTKARAGEPIADSFGIVVRENSAILALADGVNWGEKASVAARSAVHGCIDYLNKALYKEGGGKVENTLDVFVCLLRSFSAAHNLILQENGKLTTLTVAAILQLKNSNRFIVCTCNVGDTLAYVYNKEYGVREITQGSHDIYSMRDMRDALGALGPVDGKNPELNNLTVAMTIVDKDDIVFLTSDGVSDNFDPVVGKFALAKKPEKYYPNSADIMKVNANGQIINKSSDRSQKKSQNKSNNVNNINYHCHKILNKLPNSRNNVKNLVQVQNARRKSEGMINKIPIDKKTGDNNDKKPSKRFQVKIRRSNSNPDKDLLKLARYSLPIVSAQQRHELTLLRMEDLIRNGMNVGDSCCTSAKRLCELMIEFASQLTVAKRRILEDPELYDESDLNFDQFEQRQRRKKVGDKLAAVPGKLDHASIVAFRVDFYGDYKGKCFEDKNVSTDKKYNLKLKATLAKDEVIHESGPI